MTCDLCGSQQAVNLYTIYPPDGGITSRYYCDACVDAARKRNVRHAAYLFFLPTVGLMRLWKFARCSREEMGDLMVASETAHDRNPLEHHILWPYGAGQGTGAHSSGYRTLEDFFTREGVEKRQRRMKSTTS